MGLKRYESIALFFITLLVMLPFYVADAHAASQVTQVTISGQDGLNAITRESDFLSITAKVKVQGDNDVTPDQVFFGATPFQSCVPVDTQFYGCTFTDAFARAIGPGAKTAQVIAKDDEGANVAQGSGNYYADITPPLVTIFNFDEDTEAGTITLDFSATDSAQVTAPANVCTGIAGFTVYSDDVAAHVITGNGECSMTGSEVIAATTFGGAPGEREICIEAVDLFNQVSDKKCGSYLFDQNPPIFDPSTISITADGDEIFFIGANERVEVDIELAIIDDSLEPLDKNTITADFSNVVTSSGFSSKKATTCTFADGINTCTWSNIPIEIAADAADMTVVYKAQDTKGNEGSIAIDYALYMQVDSTPPQITEIISIFQDSDGNHYIGDEDNQIIVFVDETESLLAVEDMRATGPVSGEATECIDGVGCYWNFTGASGSDGTVVTFEVSASSTDIAGNQIEGDRELDLIVDKNRPFMKMLNVSNDDGRHCGWTQDQTDQCKTESFYRSEDSLFMVAEVEERASELFAFVNVSTISDIEELVPGFCEERLEEDLVDDETDDDFEEDTDDSEVTEEDTGIGVWDCFFQDVGPLNANQNGKMDFLYRDSAGNEFTETVRIKVFRRARDQQYWSHVEAVEMMPERLDRKISAAVEQQSFLHLRAVPADDAPGSLEVREMRILGCDDSLDAFLVADAREFEEVNDLERWFKFTFNRFHSEVNGELANNISVSCLYSITGTIGTKLASPEEVNGSFKVDMYNLPIGFVDDDIQAEIDQIKEDAAGQKKWQRLQQIMSLITAICGLFGAWTTIVMTMTAVVDFFSCLGPVSFGASCGVSESIGNTLNVFNQGGQTGWRVYKRWLCAAASCTLQEEIKAEAKKYPTLAKVAQVMTDPIGQIKYGGNTIHDVFDKEGAFTKQYTKISNRGKGENGVVSTKTAHTKIFNPLQTGVTPRIVRQNIALSVLFVCLPGIADFMVKRHETKCKYASCLEQQVPFGTPKEVCDLGKQYDECMLNWQQVTGLLDILPFVQLWNELGQLFALFACTFDPDGDNTMCAIQLGLVATSMACFWSSCGRCGSCGACSVCQFLTMWDMVTQVKTTLARLFGGENPVWESGHWTQDQVQYCSALLEEPEEPTQPSNPDAGNGGND